MKKIIFTINLALLLSLTTLAQQQQKEFKKDPNSVDTPSTRKRTVDNKESSTDAADSADNVLLESGTNMEAKLLSTLDVRKSNVGDEVILKTTQSIKQDGQVVVPKGTRLIGRITEVTRKSDENNTSSMSLVFESLQNKNLTTPITATVVSITNAKGGVTASPVFGAEGMGSSNSSGSVSRGGSGGGLLGGATSTVGGVLNTTTDTLGGVTGTVGNTASGATGTLGRSLNGIQINQSASASASGSTTLTAQNKNIRLEKGTQFQVQLTEAIQN